MRASWFCADLREPWLTTTSAASKKKEQQSAPNVAHRLVGSNGALEALQVDFWPSTLSLPQASLASHPEDASSTSTHTRITSEKRGRSTQYIDAVLLSKCLWDIAVLDKQRKMPRPSAGLGKAPRGLLSKGSEQFSKTCVEAQ